MPATSPNRWLLAGGYACLLITALAAYGARRRPAQPEAPPDVLSGNPAGVVAVVFQLRDCGGSIERLTAWNQASGPGGPRVVGFVIDPPQEAREVRATLAGSGIRFPVVDGGRYFRRLLGSAGYSKTPVAMVFDAQGRVRLALPLGASFRSQDARRVVELARTTAAAGGE